MNKYVIINGCGGVGKDEFIKKCRIYKDNIVNMSTIEYVKKVAIQCGWDGKKDDKGRRFLSDLKDALTRYDNIPVKHILESLHNYVDSIIFIHCREPDEIKFLKNSLNAKSLLIKNENIPLIETNHADKCVFDIDYDYVVDNSGTIGDLIFAAQIFLMKLENEYGGNTNAMQPEMPVFSKD